MSQPSILQSLGGPLGGQKFEFRGGNAMVGSAPDCTVRLEAPGVEGYHARIVIDRYLELAQGVCEERRRKGLDAFGTPLPCAATTRHGTQCARRPVDGTGYCPSHRHLGHVLVA